MNRKEIKESAKSKIKGNLWKLLWPSLAIGALSGMVSSLLSPKATVDITTGAVTYANASFGNSVILIVFGLVLGIAMIAYKKYVLNFVRTGKCEFNDIINCIKEKWLNIIVAEFLVGIIVAVASIVIIPGIILAFAYTMVTYIVVDTDLSAVDSMKKSREMMKGYKWDYFVFCLSFIGWALLIPLTFGLILIWLEPYMAVAETIYYERLKAK
ncbi:MAG: DUF975 family protein [Bacilli bacterium]|nr:DUF975 family protein [Bacilli bacterium]